MELVREAGPLWVATDHPQLNRRYFDDPGEAQAFAACWRMLRGGSLKVRRSQMDGPASHANRQLEERQRLLPEA